jgi:hypothetical protein
MVNGLPCEMEQRLTLQRLVLLKIACSRSIIPNIPRISCQFIFIDKGPTPVSCFFPPNQETPQ